MDALVKNLPLIIPIVLIEISLAITALIHVLKHPKYKFGKKPFWIVFVLIVQIIGPVIYFVLGRGEE